MNFGESITICFKKYADFSGRARRSEYWYFRLFVVLANTLLGFILADAPIVSTLFMLATLLPSLAVSWRRLHDIGKSGAWNFIILVPIVGTILLLIWNCKDSSPESNQYGPCPKA